MQSFSIIKEFGAWWIKAGKTKIPCLNLLAALKTIEAIQN